ncbi:MAG: carbon-nitrogen hydrolase family protein [Candidatus Latescibacteria bacterium]|nr:carbon-nitrogen hydrolase family protein [Candidatus Latescibacterota bacterium]
MSNFLNVACISYSPPWEGTDEEVLPRVHRELKELVGRCAVATRPDLIVLPETLCRNYVEAVPGGPTTRLLAGLARKYNTLITVPVRQRVKGKIYNVLALLDRRGHVAGVYRKYIPVYPEFDHGTCAGEGATLIPTEFGPVGCAICFDLNFSELREQYKVLGPKLLLFSSMYHGGVVQNWWALDLHAFFAGSVYRGTPCSIIDPQGTTLAQSNNYEPWAAARINLDFEVIHLDRNQARYGDIHRQYGDQVRIVTAGQVGTSVLYSESPERTAADLVAEFDLMRLDDYFAWSRQLRLEHR